jgi:DNA-binding MarR family transcriptional regulator
MSEDPGSEMDRSIAAFRKFNRIYTRIIGLLDEEIVNLGHTLAEARVMFEMAQRGTAGPGELAGELNMDAGYLSRILRKLEQEGLLSRAISAKDARSAVLRLTRKGRTAFGKLDRQWTEQTRRILERLTPKTQADLIHSMETIGAALAPGKDQRPFILRPHRVGDMGWLVERQAKLYVEEYGWDGQYEGLAA